MMGARGLVELDGGGCEEVWEFDLECGNNTDLGLLPTSYSEHVLRVQYLAYGFQNVGVEVPARPPPSSLSVKSWRI